MAIVEFGLTEERREKIKSVLACFPNIEEVVIFGSRALGNYRLASDVDLAVKGKWLDYSRPLS